MLPDQVLDPWHRGGMTNSLRALRPVALIVGLALAASGLLAAPAQAAVGDITNFPLNAGSAPRDVVVGPDGNFWVTNSGGNSVSKVSLAGAVLGTYAMTSANAGVRDIAVGPDGNLWVTLTTANKIARVTTAGVVTEFGIPTADSQPIGIAAGADGALWFTEFAGNKVGRITTSGQVTNEYTIPTANAGLWGITPGPTGSSRMYFTESTAGKVGYVTLTGQIAETALQSATSTPRGIVVQNGSVWFTMYGANAMGNLVNDTTVAQIPTVAQPNDVTVGPNNSMWVSAGSQQVAYLNNVGATQGTYTTSAANTLPQGLVQGSDGNIWVALQGANALARVTSGEMPVSTAAPAITPTVGVIPGTALNVSNGTWNPTPTSYTYQWQRCTQNVASSCTNIAGATASAYTATTADNGVYLRAGVSGSNASGPAAMVYSALVVVGKASPTPSPTPNPTPAPATGLTASIGANAVMDLDSPANQKRGARKTYVVDFSTTDVKGTVTFVMKKGGRVKTFANVPVTDGAVSVSWKVPKKWPLKKTTVTATYTPASGSQYSAGQVFGVVKIKK